MIFKNLNTHSFLRMGVLLYIFNVRHNLFKKGEIALQFIKISFILFLLIYALCFIILCYKSGKMIKTMLLSAVSGLAVMTAVNLLSKFTGVFIAVNGWTTLSSALFGMPGVLGLLIIRMFF